MVDSEENTFKLRSPNNVYIINLKLLNYLEEPKLEITLRHKLKNGDKIYFLETGKEELISQAENLAEFDTIQEIYKYIISLIRNQGITIIRPNKAFYNIKLFDKEKNIYFQIVIQKNKKENEEIMKLKNTVKELESQITMLKETIQKRSKIEQNSAGASIKDSAHDKTYISRIEVDEGENKNKYLYKENNNNISFSNIPNKINDGFIISKEKEQCENFTAFLNSNNEGIIVWTIREKGTIKLYNFKKDLYWTLDDAHSKKINSVQYFCDINEYNEYIISLSQADLNMMKIWQFVDDDEFKLELKKVFNKSDFNMVIEVFCIFNTFKYDENHSFLFIYGKHIDKKKIKKINEGVHNTVQKNEILCYKLDKDLNIVKSIKNNGKEINHEKINNYYEVKNLDTFYDFDNKELYLINSNIHDVEVINSLFEYNRATIFRYEEWNTHHSAFIKKINKSLKLFDICLNGLIIWNFENNEKPEKFLKIDDFCPFDLISWNANYLLVSGDKKILVVDISKKEIEKVTQIDKKGFSKIRKILTPKSEELIVSIDNYQVKCWPITK